MIQTQKQLENFIHSIRNETHLAIDTEFKRTSTYYPVLCLVQIATKSNTDCIDVLAINDLTPLFDKLYQDECLWIVHSARQDIEALYYLSNKLPKKLFDTQIAASLLNYPGQISYQALTESLQNVFLEKAYTRLDWTTRPLPDGAIEYALDDVRYLIKNYFQLEQQLESEGKLNWISEESNYLLDVQLYNPPVDNAWQKVKGFSRLAKKYHTYAAQLAAYREQQAKSKNKPRKWIMADDKLIAYVLGSEKLSKKAEDSFNKFIANNQSLESIKVMISNKIPTKAEKMQKKELQKLIQKIANKYNLDDKIIANGKSLLSFIRGDRSVIFLKGWRYEILQGEIENAK